MVVEKAFACVTHDGKALVFDHPVAGTQFVKGTVEPGESVEEAVLRELTEESGLSDGSLIESLGIWEGVGQREVGLDIAEERQRWHVWLVRLDSDPGETWGHCADQGHVYSFRWIDIGPRLIEEIHPMQRPVAEMLVRATK